MWGYNLKILFWNTHSNNVNEYIVNLVIDNGIDVLVMAEYEDNEDELKMLFDKAGISLTLQNTISCKRISFWCNYKDIEPDIQESYYSIQVIKSQYIICCVHLFSNMYGDGGDERLEIIHTIMEDIKKAEERIHSQKTIIIGDMNEMPYDNGCLNANGFHGLPELNLEDRPTRKVRNVEYRKFYNPMWNLMGDFSYPPGTYYYNQAKLHNPMWYMFDQIILSKDILPEFKRESLKILTSCSYAKLMDENMHPNKEISDHFPIMCEIKDV